MNLQERLLQNEIKHLGQIIQTLSYELIVLQDFLKDAYGPKFERFRRNYSNSSGNSTVERSRKKQCRNVFEQGKSERYGCEQTVDKSRDHVDIDDLPLDNGENMMVGNELSDSDANHDEMFSDSDTSVTLKDPLDVDSYDERKGGRKKTKIWKYFDKVFHKNNKFTARCHLCHGLVSSRASRMVEHRLKCKQRQDRRKSVYKSDIKSDNDREACKQLKNDENETGQFSDDESFLCSENDQSDNEIKDKTTQKSGRSLDFIWKYFEIVYQNNLKKAKCMTCGKYVSPKAVRMRQHKIGCTNEGKFHASIGGN